VTVLTNVVVKQTQFKIGLGIGAALLGLTAAGQSLHLRGSQGLGSPLRISIFVGCCLLACAVFAGGVFLARRQQLSIWLVLLVAGLLRILVLVSPPFLSTALYRYVWDGRVQLAGINPYIYVPAAPELKSLRDQAIFPNINRPDYAVTIYPPVAQMIFRSVARVAQTPYAIKAAAALFDTITIIVLIRLLSSAGKPVAQVVVYAWHPLPIWEFAGNGHIDAAAICFIAVALLAASWRSPALACAALAGAVLVKFLPAVLLPAFWHRQAGRKLGWGAPLAFAAVIVAAYLCYASAGRHVLGFLPGYASEEGVAHETRLFPLALLARFVRLPGWAGAAYYAGAAIGLLALGAAVFLRAWKDATDVPRVAGAALLLATSLTIAIFPHYPWYFAWLLLPCTLLPALSVLYLTSAVFLIYLASYDESLLWPCLIYGPFGLLALRDLIALPRQNHLQRS